MRTLEELDEMQRWLDPERQTLTPQVMEQRRTATRKKLHEVLDFLRGK
jgi:hypothetical protein